MATLKHIATGQTHSLSATTMIGRGPRCDLRLGQRLASSEHASVRWTGKSWEVRDLGSRNGTFIGSRRLKAGETMEIIAGSRLGFGDSNDLYEVSDDLPPVASARAEDGEVRTAQGGLLVLPDDEKPEHTVFEDGPDKWFIEDASGERKAIENQAEVQSGGRTWQLDLPTIAEETWQHSGPLFLSGLGMRFQVSPDEEHIEMYLVRGGQLIPLGARAHAYLLLTLARLRLADGKEHQRPEAERGWIAVEELIKMLNITENQLNVTIFRARQQMAMASVRDATAIIERRPGARQIRLGVKSLEIISS